MGLDRDALAGELRAAIEGEVRFGDGDRAVYSADASNYRQVPIGVVVPATVDDVVAAVEVCRRHGAPVLPRGGGTSVAGQCVNEAVVLDTTRHLTRILEIGETGPEGGVARVEPGVVLDDLQRAAAPYGLRFGPDPATHDRCTLGGMIGNNSCGVHSLTSGRTADQVVELDVLTYDGLRLVARRTTDAERDRIVAGGGRRGAIYGALAELADHHAGEIRARYPRIPRRVSGYNLDELLPERGFHVGRALAGTEGTCVTVLEATVRLVPAVPARSLVVAGFSDVAVAADHAPDVLAFGPVGLEGFDEGLAGFARRKGLWDRDLALLPEGGGWLLVEMGGDSAPEAEARAAAVAASMERAGAACARLGEDEARRIWRLREAAAGAASFVPGGPEYWPGWEDSAVPPDRLGPYLRDLLRLFDAHGYEAGLYGHFGEGCIHCRVDFGLRTPQGRQAWRRFLEEAADLVVGYGGSLSGEHGDGQARAFLLPRMFGDELTGAFRAFKSVWDPEGRMNPGKVVDALPFDANLRLGKGHRPRLPAGTATFFDHGPGGFARATERCVGVGACRRSGGGTMCPSFRATRDEQHSTRGRARLLFEMLEGDVVADGWRSVAVREALDLCLACKACRTECPVGVDMAAWKAEFLAHHYRGRLRPRVAWSMGLFHRWSRVASLAPRLFNALTGAPGIGAVVRRLAGVAPQRRIPRFAQRTFTRRFTQQTATPETQRSVVLWPDTFSNRLHPEVLEAAADVLADAGFAVTIPGRSARSVCCGRPLYDFGMLRAARRQLRSMLRVLAPAVRDGLPVVVLEPSCLSVFRDELRSMLPGDPEAARLSGLAVSLAELLTRAGYAPPEVTGRALVHGHCHQKALSGMDADAALLAKAGLETEILDAGCCGMAGAFGFDRRHYEVSMQIGELALLPAVRAAPPDTLLVADGMSCREQILQSTGRRALHTAEVLRMGLRRDAP